MPDKASIAYFATLFGVTAATLYLVPPVEQEACKELSFSTFFSGSSNLKGMAKEFLECGEAYKADNPVSAIVLYSVLYTAFLAASVPGCTTMLSVLSGALWHPAISILLITINSSTGGLCAYYLSHLMLRETVTKRFPSLFTKLRKSIESFGSNIWFAMIFLRVTPLVPNWFVSLGAPMVDMPPHVFFFGGMIGFIPSGIFHCLNGRALKQLVDSQGVDPKKAFLTLFGLQFIVLLPLWLCGKRSADKLAAEIRDKKD
eukprot:CAMPEP_0167823010 /NCGR_PEP_ID=MMETSP0112_2-20121227/7872_1 /TAXON_ID=91324 /ORGANISM="Lotharella globosa, Strain CCCM811" /LENGTH=257 /DNA_ID=CAMNT_0007724557 /DNA_START=17 /DNA_END=790 /DNA_ORIENTATION=+